MANLEETFLPVLSLMRKESALVKIQKGGKKRCQYWTAKVWGIFKPARKPNSTEVS